MKDETVSGLGISYKTFHCVNLWQSCQPPERAFTYCSTHNVITGWGTIIVFSQAHVA